VSARPPTVDPFRYDPPERIVSLTPSNTEIVCAIGGRERLVGISQYCDYPSDVQGLPRVSRFIDADYDAIVALQPDLVLTSSHLQRPIVEQLIERDVTVLAFNPNDLDDVFRDVLLLGRLLGTLDRARTLVAGLRERVEAVVAAGAALLHHPRVYLEEWGKPLIPAGWWLADFVELAGGMSVLPQMNRRAHSRERIVEPEEVRAGDPEVIIVSWPGVHNDAPRRRAMTRPEWKDVTAIRHGHVYSIPDWLLHRPGPRLVDGLEEIARIIAGVAQSEDVAGVAQGISRV
jgi:iron complex transport system substrate-binding protein